MNQTRSGILPAARAARRIPPRAAALLAALCLGSPAEVRAQGRGEAGCRGEGASGVSRTLTVETAGGARYGSFHFGPLPLARGEVVLTFDDGPRPETTPAVLDALRAACVRATFMMVGRMVDRAPDLARQVAQEGHAVGAHGWSHKPLNRMPVEEATADVRRGFASLERALRGLPRDQAPRPLFRFPSYAQTPELLDWLARSNVAVMSADTTSEDWKGGPPEATLALTLERLKRRGSGVVVFHDTQPNTAALLPEFLSRLKAEGFRVVHLRTREPASLPGS